MGSITNKLLNNYQQVFPLVSEPFDDVARHLGSDTQTVLTEIRSLREQGIISRVGPVFRPNTVGVSTLAAISVPTDRLEHYANIVNQFPQVNHNYEREHVINLWFVLTAADQTELNTTLSEIEKLTGHYVLILPLLKEYHIDLGFNLQHLNANKHFGEQKLLDRLSTPEAMTSKDMETARDLITAIQGGLPLVEKPYQALAEKIELSEAAVIDQLKKLIHNGAIKRFGVIVRHREVGYTANAMVVWDISDEQVDQIGKLLGDEPCVTLCYKRPRIAPHWRYNLFCMIHGRKRSEVLDCIQQLSESHGLTSVPRDILFSGRCFKQRGARYQLAPQSRLSKVS